MEAEEEQEHLFERWAVEVVELTVVSVGVEVRLFEVLEMSLLVAWGEVVEGLIVVAEVVEEHLSEELEMSSLEELEEVAR